MLAKFIFGKIKKPKEELPKEKSNLDPTIMEHLRSPEIKELIKTIAENIDDYKKMFDL